VTDAMMDTLADGGNAADAAIVGALLHGVVQQEMTNHTGTISCLYYEAKTGQFHELNSWGTIVPHLPAVRPVRGTHGDLCQAGREPFAVIPGFMPGLRALHQRFASKAWEHLCQPAIEWAERGNAMTSLQGQVFATEVPLFLYTPSGRAHFTPHGHLPQVGDLWPKPALAETLRKTAKEGPDYFISGEWADHFIERAHEVGWKISRNDMEANEPRWGSGVRYQHAGQEIVQLSPPETQAVRCSMVLDMLTELGVPEIGHWSQEAESLYYLAHALRRASYETGYMNDPAHFAVPTDVLMSPDYHRMLAGILRESRPRVDLTNHTRAASGPSLRASGASSFPPAGSCETSLVDSEGNWMQMMNTLQSGGIPGEVVDGVPMVGSHSQVDMSSWIAGWFAEGGRMRGPMGNTFVLRDGKPWLSLGTPGSLWATVVQVLSGILDFGMDPVAAADAPRLLAMTDAYEIPVESRLPTKVVDDLAAMGVTVDPLEPYNWHLGSFQMSWRDSDGVLHGTTDPRREGKAAAM
jgi:gamma-glutamyltranspeptidase/glutathione hydrolase